jgi:PAS domain S-box-containing protein
MCGWLGAELIGQPIHTLLRQPLPRGMLGPPARAAGDPAWADPSATTVTDGVFWRKDGTSFPAEYLSSPIWDQHTLIGAVVTFKDITERKHAELAQRFLIEASTLLGSSLDYETTLEQVAQLSVPYLADWCAVHLLVADGTVHRLAVIHTNPTKAAIVHERPNHYRLDLNGQHLVPQVVRTGQSELIAEVSDALLVAAARDAEHLQTLRTLGFSSYMCVPLLVRERTLGAITFASTTAGRRYTAPDLALAEEVARRAALAIDNAGLYRAAQEQREWLHVTLSSIGDAVIATDITGHVTFMNLVAGELTGWQPADAIGRDMHELLTIISGATGTPTENPVAQILREGAIVDRTDHTLLIARDGTEHPIEVRGAAIRSDARTMLGVVLVFRDITERHAAEAALQHLNADLERRVVERTAQLEAINKELESFSYSVSHDLRAPLRSIDGFSQALLEDYGDKLDSDGQEYLQRVRAATQRMAQLIDDLLSLARVTRSELHHDLVDLSAHAATIAEELQRTQPDRLVAFMIAPGLVTHGDERLLHLVLDNLLANAWKFTSKRPCAQIEFGAVAGADPQAYFVRDNGAGFDMAYADKLFGAFQRLHAMTEFAGTGIGLATVQRVIHRHGGRVWAESALDQGATFFFSVQPEARHP